MLALLGEFEVVVSDIVLEEVERFFRENFSREAGYLSRRLVEELSAKIVRRGEMKEEIDELRGSIKHKDLENIAAIRHEEINYLVACDDDYMKAKIKEYITPKNFVTLFGLKPYDTDH